MTRLDGNGISPDFTFIDLFAGIGGFHYAMHDNGGNCVFASEKDKFARITYETNFKKISPELFENPQLFNNDITQLDFGVLPDFDVLCGGFPCQPFSMAGQKLGFEDTRGTLFFNISEIIRHKQKEGKPPKVILLENVKHFKHHNKGRTMETVRRTLEELLGYNFTYKVLNSRDFGLPQNRARVFMVAWLPELGPFFTFPEPVAHLPTKLGDILEMSVDSKYTISDNLWASHQRRKREHIERGNGFGFSLVTKDSEYTSTMSARYYKDGSEILIAQEGKNPRKLTPREAARLQGFPEEPDFVIPVSDVQAYKQFGNAVSVPVVRAIGAEIKRQLLNVERFELTYSGDSATT
ncbi:MAG: DNA cytosine methyltransferase [Anaerolineae bacterium]|nr:DNA cytosine methyltransferase [Anaerolineae bacterium]